MPCTISGHYLRSISTTHGQIERDIGQFVQGFLGKATMVCDGVSCALKATFGQIRHSNFARNLTPVTAPLRIFNWRPPVSSRAFAVHQMGQPAALCLDGAVPTAVPKKAHRGHLRRSKTSMVGRCSRERRLIRSAGRLTVEPLRALSCGEGRRGLPTRPSLLCLWATAWRTCVNSSALRAAPRCSDQQVQ